VNCSSNEAGFLGEGLPRRLSAALIASFALHAALIAGIASHTGGRSDAISRDGGGPDLHVSLRELSPAPTETAARAAGLPIQRYYRTRELDVRPGIMTRVQPEYPESAARRFLAGSVRIELYIDEAGRVERVQTLHAEPPGYFEASTQSAFLAARFTPGMKDGRPVKVKLRLEVKFGDPPP
jgi:TonB family protein